MSAAAAAVRTCVLGLLLVVPSACDSKKPASADSSSTQERAKPVGKPLAKQSQILGRWVRDDDGDILAIEFGQDSKAIVHLTSIGLQGAIIFDYALMDGGRVRLTPGSGSGFSFTQIFACSVKDSNMTFEPESEDVMSEIKHSSRFVRLKEGETLQGVLKARAEAENKRQQEILAAAQAVVSQPNLALVSADPKMNLDKFALDLKSAGGNSFTGVAYWAGRVVVARQAQLYLQRGGPNQPATVNLTLGQVVGPPGMQQFPGETFTFQVRGDLPKVDITDGGRALRSDADTFKSITDRFKKEAEARLAKMNEFADQFGAFCRLDGELHYPGNPAARPTRMVLGLLRVEGKPAFMFADMGRDSNPLPAAFNQQIGVELAAEDRPILSFGSPQYIAASSANDGTTFEGAMSGMEGAFKVGLRLSKEELAKRRAGIADFLDKQMGAGITLRGLHYDSDQPEPIVPIYAVQFEIRSAQRLLSGTVSRYHAPARCEIAGKAIETLLGAKFDIDASKVIEDTYATMRGRGPGYKFDVQWESGRPTFTCGMIGGSQNNHVEVVIATPHTLKQDREALERVLASGADFIARGGGTMPARPPSITFKLDGDTITGTSHYKNRQGPIPGVLSGKVVETGGLVKLEFRQTPGTPPGAQAATYHMWAVPEGDTVVMTGYTVWDFENPKRAVPMSFRSEAK